GDLVGKTWLLTSITIQNPAFDGDVPADQQDRYTMTFAADGTFSAQADCNQVLGSWTATSSGGLTLSLGPSTTVECADGSLSDIYIIALGQATSYAIASSQLTITLERGGSLVYR
ncbi:MAG: META domain-containing protein, partial [Candidatus Limnocylindrales bacterium]